MIAPFSSPLNTGRTMNVHETFRRHLVATGKSYGKIWDGFSPSTGKRVFLKVSF